MSLKTLGHESNSRMSPMDFVSIASLNAAPKRSSVGHCALSLPPRNDVFYRGYVVPLPRGFDVWH